MFSQQALFYLCSYICYLLWLYMLYVIAASHATHLRLRYFNNRLRSFIYYIILLILARFREFRKLCRKLLYLGNSYISWRDQLSACTLSVVAFCVTLHFSDICSSVALWIMGYVYTDFNNICSKKLANHNHSILQRNSYDWTVL